MRAEGGAEEQGEQAQDVVTNYRWWKPCSKPGRTNLGGRGKRDTPGSASRLRSACVFPLLRTRHRVPLPPFSRSLLELSPPFLHSLLRLRLSCWHGAPIRSRFLLYTAPFARPAPCPLCRPRPVFMRTHLSRLCGWRGKFPLTPLYADLHPPHVHVPLVSFPDSKELGPHTCASPCPSNIL